MGALLNWNSFRYKFDGREQEAFEKLAYALFCRKYGLTGGVPRKFNQWYIETDPVQVGNDYIGFQAKHYVSPTVNGDQARELSDTVRKAHEKYPQLTVLQIYLVNEFSDSKDSGMPKRQEEVETVAGECGIRIEWVLPSNFEIILNEPEYSDLKKYFFVMEASDGNRIPKCLTTYLPVGPEIGLVGRDQIVDELRAMLDTEKCVALVRGLGGIGKTAVMHKVCDKILTDGNEENHVAWITCGESLEDDLLAFSDAFGVPKEIGREEAFDAVLREMKGIKGRLYLFLDDLSRDSVKKDLERLNALRPNVHVMITSRREIKGIPHKVLKELKEDSAVDMFYGYYEHDEERKYLKDVVGIIDSESVKRHTLLVELLAKAAGRSFDTLEEFRKELEEKGFFEVSKARVGGPPDENLTIEESVKRLYDISGLSDEQKRIMRLFSIFTPEKSIYGKVVEWAGLDDEEVNGLVGLGWLARAESGYVIHQIVRDSIARQVGDSLRIEDYGSLINKLADTDSYMPVELEYTKIRERLVLAEDVARYAERRTGSLLKTEEWPEQDVTFLKVCSALFNNMAGVYRAQGDYAKALEYYEKALRIVEQVLGVNHPYTAATYNNMAGVYEDQGDYAKALEYYEKTLRIVERVLGSGHPSTATTYNNMAGVYYAQGKALEYYEKALEIRERVLGSGHPSTATTYNNMAGVYEDQGDYAKALEYYEKALRIVEQVLGVDHPYTATTYNNMAGVYYAQGDYAKALGYYEKALAVFEAKLGETHPYTQNVQQSVMIMKILIEHGLSED